MSHSTGLTGTDFSRLRAALAMLPLLLIGERRVTWVPLLEESEEEQAQRRRDQRADRACAEN